jgi:hypothetical protein
MTWPARPRPAPRPSDESPQGESSMTSLVDAFFDNPMLAASMRAWQSLAQGSLLSYDEPILPGWTINIDSNNSSSPAMERDVLQVASYGKQIGRLSDAVAALVALQPKEEQAKAPFKAFADLQHDVARVKLQGIERRVARMAADLAHLKSRDHPKFVELAAQLDAVIDA